MTRACLDVDVRVDAPLADEPEFREAFEQLSADRGPLANEDESLRVFQALGERTSLLNMVVPDVDLVSIESAKAGKRPQRVEVVVENRDPHATPLLTLARAQAAASTAKNSRRADRSE